MATPTPLFDRAALVRMRERARRTGAPALFLQDEAAVEIAERLELVNKSFTSPAIVGGWPEAWQHVVTDALIVDDTETLPLQPGAHDLIIHALSLHWSNDPVGQLIQCRRALKPDGLFLAVLFGGRTLQELRAVLAEAEAKVTGGLSPRVAPMAEIRDLGGLLQRAGFALPVTDAQTTTASYRTPLHLMRDLRAMGEGNALAGRLRHPTRRQVLHDASALYQSAYGDASGRVPATFEMIFLSGWAPDASQPQPLRPGSATSRLADALGASEMKLREQD